MIRHNLARSSAQLGSMRSSSARGSANWSSGIRSPRLGSALSSASARPQLGSALGSARLGSAGYSGFGSSLLLTQARLGAPDLGSGINSMLGSAQLGAWFGLSSCVDSGLATQHSAWLDSGLRSTYLERSLPRLISAMLISAHIFL